MTATGVSRTQMAAMIAANRPNMASAYSPPLKLPVASLNQPTIGGLALPPKMPTELTQAMPLAKAGPVRNTAGSGNRCACDA